MKRFLVALGLLALAGFAVHWAVTSDPGRPAPEDGAAAAEEEADDRTGGVVPGAGGPELLDRAQEGGRRDSGETSRAVMRHEGPFTLHGEILDAVSLEPVTLYRMLVLKESEDLAAAQREPHRFRTFANPIGTFTYKDLEAGAYQLFVTIPGYEDLLVRGVELPAATAGEEKLSLRMSRGAWVEVTINDFAGDGVSDLEVRIDPVRLDDPHKAPSVHLLRTDDHGRCVFTNLPPGVYRVRMENAALAELASADFYLGPGGSQQLGFRVPELNTVLVSAADTQGQPLGQVSVRMWSAEGRGIFRAETEADGSARLRHVPAGDYHVKLYKHGFRRQDQAFAVPASSGAPVPLRLTLTEDPAAVEAELQPTQEQIDRLKRGERPSEVFGGGGG